MAKKQIAIRLSEATLAKLKRLQEIYGTQTEVMAVAIDRLSRENNFNACLNCDRRSAEITLNTILDEWNEEDA